MVRTSKHTPTAAAIAAVTLMTPAMGLIAESAIAATTDTTQTQVDQSDLDALNKLEAKVDGKSLTLTEDHTRRNGWSYRYNKEFPAGAVVTVSDTKNGMVTSLGGLTEISAVKNGTTVNVYLKAIRTAANQRFSSDWKGGPLAVDGKAVATAEQAGYGDVHVVYGALASSGSPSIHGPEGTNMRSADDERVYAVTVPDRSNGVETLLILTAAPKGGLASAEREFAEGEIESHNTDFGTEFALDTLPGVGTRPDYGAVKRGDATGDGGFDMDDIKALLGAPGNEVTELHGNGEYGAGDFRSAECLELLDEADVVVTNPPFSLFREYVATLMDYDKKFVIMGNINAVTYKEIFPLIRNNKLWPGFSFNKAMRFAMPEEYESRTDERDEKGWKISKVPAIAWYTNLDIVKRHENLLLYRRYKGHEDEYPKYDNYDAIEMACGILNQELPSRPSMDTRSTGACSSAATPDTMVPIPRRAFITLPPGVGGPDRARAPACRNPWRIFITSFRRGTLWPRPDPNGMAVEPRLQVGFPVADGGPELDVGQVPALPTPLLQGLDGYAQHLGDLGRCVQTFHALPYASDGGGEVPGSGHIASHEG